MISWNFVVSILRYKEKLRLRQAEQEEREKQKTKYRDRAKELREGKNLDYAVMFDRIRK